MQIERVKPGGRKPLHLAGLVAGVITPEEAATARFIPGLGVQFTEIEADEADRLEELLTALGIERVQAVGAPEVRPPSPGRAGRGESRLTSPAPRGPAARGGNGHPGAIPRDSREAP